MNDIERRRELGQQLRVDSIRCSAAAKSGHPTSGMSAADLMAVLLDRYLRSDFFADPRTRRTTGSFSRAFWNPLPCLMNRIPVFASRARDRSSIARGAHRSPLRASRAAASISAPVLAWPAMPQLPSDDSVISTQVRLAELGSSGDDLGQFLDDSGLLLAAEDIARPPLGS